MKPTTRALICAATMLSVFCAAILAARADDATDYANQLYQAQKEREEWQQQREQAEKEREDWQSQREQAQKDRDQFYQARKEREDWQNALYQAQKEREDYQKGIMEGNQQNFDAPGAVVAVPQVRFFAPAVPRDQQQFRQMVLRNQAVARPQPPQEGTWVQTIMNGSHVTTLTRDRQGNVISQSGSTRGMVDGVPVTLTTADYATARMGPVESVRLPR
jgi:septal ring factor EnvC (AmiA/AmiB activator)